MWVCWLRAAETGRKILPVSHYGFSHTAATDEPAYAHAACTVVGTCVKFLFSSLSRTPPVSTTLFRRKKILVTVMLRVRQKEFEMIYARSCFVKSMIIS